MNNALVKKLIDDLFVISFATFVVFFGLEFLFAGLISNYFDLHVLLLATVVFGGTSLIANRDTKGNHHE